MSALISSLNTFQTSSSERGGTGWSGTEAAIELLLLALGAAGDYQAITYIGSTNNVSTRVFKTGGSSGTTIATLTYTYVAAGAADNDKLATVTRS